MLLCLQCIQQIVCCIAIAVLFCVGCSEARTYQNNYDDSLNFQCTGSTQAISSIYSVHSNHHEDRKFSISCRNLPYCTGTRSCTPAGQWVNDFDKMVSFHCPPNQYIVGMESVHSNNAEDRRWKFTCCGYSGEVLHGCSRTEWTNYYDEVQDYTVPSGYVITGVTSVHNNHYEDRRFKFDVCQVQSAYEY